MFTSQLALPQQQPFKIGAIFKKDNNTEKNLAFPDSDIIFVAPLNKVDQKVLYWLLSWSFYIWGLQFSAGSFFDLKLPCCSTSALCMKILSSKYHIHMPAVSIPMRLDLEVKS